MSNQGLGKREIRENYFEPLSNYDLDNLNKVIKNKNSNWVKYNDIQNGQIQNLKQLLNYLVALKQKINMETSAKIKNLINQKKAGE